MLRPAGTSTFPPLRPPWTRRRWLSAQNGKRRASACSPGESPPRAPATPWPPSAGACPGWRCGKLNAFGSVPRAGQPVDLFGGAAPAHRCYRAFYEPERLRLARPCMPRRCSGGPNSGLTHLAPPQRATRPGVRLARHEGRYRPAERRAGLGHALVHHHRRLRRRLQAHGMARHQCVHPRRPHGCSGTYFGQQPRATNRWAAPGTTSTSPRWAARKTGKTRRPDILRRRPTSDGTGTDS